VASPMLHTQPWQKMGRKIPMISLLFIYSDLLSGKSSFGSNFSITGIRLSIEFQPKHGSCTHTSTIFLLFLYFPFQVKDIFQSLNNQKLRQTWNLSINSEIIPITLRSRNLRRFQRASLNQIGDVLHDLLTASFGEGTVYLLNHTLLMLLPVPLTEQRRDSKDIQVQATEFLSSFSEEAGRNLYRTICTAHFMVSSAARWEVGVGELPKGQGQVLHGLTDNDRSPNVTYRFLRFRFPFVRFEWHIETPYSELQFRGQTKPVQVKYMWKAWTRGRSGVCG
jgi:hypothetical protein